jgi:3-(3-hydroxy-phenyl)propionate hydroxylase
VVLDDDDTIGVRGASSRGIVYAQKTLEIFARLRIFERVLAKGVTWTKGKTLAGDDVVYEFDMALASASRQPPYINLQQFYVEWFLVDRIEALGRTDLRWRSRVTRAQARSDHVLLDVETQAGSYQLQAEWVIDASGLASVIRDGLGVATHPARIADRWCITDVRFKQPLPIERWTWVEAPFNDNRAVWQHLMADDVWRLDFQMAPDTDPDYVNRPEVAAERIRRRLGEQAEFEMVWVGPYAYRAQIAERFRVGRVFFIGDAAHVMSPFGARGGNSGIQDADNLCWKLALVLAGQAPDALLDTYHLERRHAAQVNVEVTKRTARFLAPQSPYERLQRNAAIGLAREYPFARAIVNTGRLSVANDYAQSPAVTNGGHTIQNVPLRLPDRRDAGLIELAQLAGNRFLAIWFADAAPSPAAAPALVALEARYPVKLFACGASMALPVIDDIDGKLVAALRAGPGSVPNLVES